MDKRKLSAIPREEVTEDMLVLAHQLEGIENIVTARLIEDKKILLLNFFKTANLKKGNTKAAFRTYLSCDDYITQDLTKSNVSWKTAAFDRLEGFIKADWYWKTEGYITSRTHIHEGEAVISEFFERYKRDKDISVWAAINRFQDEVKERKLNERHSKETAVIDKKMEQITEPPQDFFRWAYEEAMSFSRYVVYKETKKGMAECCCTHCGKSTVVKRDTIRLRNNEKGVCPMCGSKVTFKAKGRLPQYGFEDTRWVAYIQPTEKGFVWRYFHFGRRFNFETIQPTKVSESHKEFSRAFYEFCCGKLICQSYEYRPYKQRDIRWCDDNDTIKCGLCCLYPGNLPHAWEHTPMKYSALEYISKAIPTVAIHYEWAIKKYLDHPRLEFICKMGLNKLAAEIINLGYWRSYESELNLDAETIYEILGLNKINTRLLQAVDGGEKELKLLQVAQQEGYQFKPDVLKRYVETFGNNTFFLTKKNRKVSLHKMLRYIERESERYPRAEGHCWRHSFYNIVKDDPRIERKRNMANDWIEYLEWCNKLKYDTNNMFIYMPCNFKKVHDRTAKEYQALVDRQEAARKRRQERYVRKEQEKIRSVVGEIFKKNEGVDAFSVRGKGLLLVVPSCGEDIKREGSVLHHCVGTYLDKIAKGETSIFFIRKVDEPDKPYYTLEWKDNKVAQCRGLRNCNMTEDVRAFTEVFEKKMHEQIERQTA